MYRDDIVYRIMTGVIVIALLFGCSVFLLQLPRLAEDQLAQEREARIEWASGCQMIRSDKHPSGFIVFDPDGVEISNANIIIKHVSDASDGVCWEYAGTYDEDNRLFASDMQKRFIVYIPFGEDEASVSMNESISFKSEDDL